MSGLGSWPAIRSRPVSAAGRDGSARWLLFACGAAAAAGGQAEHAVHGPGSVLLQLAQTSAAARPRIRRLGRRAEFRLHFLSLSYEFHPISKSLLRCLWPGSLALPAAIIRFRGCD